jgi:hypothetical protein
MSYSTAILMIILFSVAAGFCVFIVRKCVHISFLQKHHEVAFTIFLQEGVIYGVLLAFSVSIVWGQFNQVAEEIEQEVSALLVVSKLSSYFPEPYHNNIERDLQKYMHSVLDREWSTMRYGNSDLQSQNDFDRLQSDLLQYKSQNLAESIVYSEVLKHVSDAREARRMRLFHSGVTVPGVIWVILIALGFLVITLPLFFGMENRFSQAIITAGLTGMITAILVLIVLLDNPFGKSLHIDKSAFIQGLAQINAS